MIFPTNPPGYGTLGSAPLIGVTRPAWRLQDRSPSWWFVAPPFLFGPMKPDGVEKQPDSYSFQQVTALFFFLKCQIKDLGTFFPENSQENWRGLKVVQTSRKKQGMKDRPWKDGKRLNCVKPSQKCAWILSCFMIFQPVSQGFSGNVTTSLWIFSKNHGFLDLQ